MKLRLRFRIRPKIKIRIRIKIKVRIVLKMRNWIRIKLDNHPRPQLLAPTWGAMKANWQTQVQQNSKPK